ncbi:unnamed protein product [Ostreobium quekettii]|uniref:SMC hinge domain-containing protein n=1 Tax=Ostreobium quekettii TaxID=121088 RepID=A0A8S1J989_9CHLO|nr:unnamed protein product [Ostreobium quekettii]
MCGEPFAVDIEAVDEHGNRCARGMVAATPTVWPEVVGGTPGKTGALVFCPGDWDCAWEQTQSGEDFFRITLSIAGPVGPIRLVVGDADGTGGSSLLLKDSLDVDLLAGPPHELMVEGPRQVRCSTQGAFGPLKIRLLDKWHNHVTDHKPFEVVLNPFALGGEEGGQAAKVSAKKHRGNRLTMTKGMATCEEVQLQAAEPGQYRVRVASTSKRLVLMDATMVVQAENTNRVVSLKLSEPSFNPNCVAGGCAALKVLVSTDDGEPLPQEAANTGLSLILTGPDDDTMRLPPLPGHAQSSQPSPSAAAFKFRTEMLNVAGAYKAVAEYVESREALLRFIGCERLRKVESVECTFEIGVGPPMRAEVYCDGMERRLADSPSVTGSNGDAVEDRRLLRNVTIAVHDRFRNPTPTTGLDVSVHLQMKDNVPPGCVLPSLTTDPSQCAVATDQQGRIELGDLVLEAGSGKVPEDSGSSALELRLVFSVGGLRDDEGRRMPLTDVLEVNVLFSDGAACSSILRSASQRMHGVEKRKAELDKQLRAAKNAADKAKKQHQGTVRAVEHERQGIHGTVPASISELRMHLDSLADRWNRQQASQPALDAAFGDPRDPQTVAVQHCLLARDPDVVGVFAQLGTVTDQRLAAVLAAACGKSLRILVVRNFQCHERLIAELDKQCLGVPAMLPMDGVRKFDTEQREAQLQMQMTNQSALSAKLHEDACAGADEPLALLLPHTLAAMKRRKGETSSYKLPPTSYPDGFVGFMCNLIRPAVQGHRSSVFWSMLNRNAVFETMKQAHAYRRYVTQTLKLPVPMTVFTLDGKKLDSRGVIEGSDWKVQPLKDARLRFGTTPPQQSVDVLMATQHLGELRRLLAAMEEEEQAGNEAAAAAKAHQDLREEVQRVKEELATERDKLKQHLKIEKSR